MELQASSRRSGYRDYCLFRNDYQAVLAIVCYSTDGIGFYVEKRPGSIQYQRYSIHFTP